MKFCQPHWEKLNEAIQMRGLGALVADSGEKAISNLFAEASEGPSVDNFDPLMAAHNAIVARAITEIREKYQQNTLMLMADPDEHPEWACPVCALAWCHDEHNRLCTQEGCNYPKEFDWEAEMIGGAADFMARQWRELNA